MKKEIKAWGVVMFDGFIPDFSVAGFAEDILQIHSSRKAAEKLAAKINKKDLRSFKAIPLTITYEIKEARKV